MVAVTQNPAIESAARAAYEHFYTSAWPPDPFDAELRTADNWRSAMRAAILTLREPSEEMVIAGCRHENMGDMAGRWSAMIDEAVR